MVVADGFNRVCLEFDWLFEASKTFPIATTGNGACRTSFQTAIKYSALVEGGAEEAAGLARYY
jgi:hypothetical protein